jgi:hypothetical protein
MLLLPCSLAAAFTPGVDVAALQREIRVLPVGERIAFWGEQFVGTPYDTDPLGEYVRKSVIIADDRVDCMYLTFRAVELALGKDPDDSLRIALDVRFLHGGKVEDGKVVNYEDRFQYGEDMIVSGKWGREITTTLEDNINISAASGKATAFIKPVDAAFGSLRSGDIVFFVNPPEKIAAGVLVGHIGIIKKEAGKVYLIHANGRKESGGSVKKVLLRDYLSKTPFAGIRVTRFPADLQMSE